MYKILRGTDRGDREELFSVVEGSVTRGMDLSSGAGGL